MVGREMPRVNQGEKIGGGPWNAIMRTKKRGRRNLAGGESLMTVDCGLGEEGKGKEANGIAVCRGGNRSSSEEWE